jgi:hypothetical protein
LLLFYIYLPSLLHTVGSRKSSSASTSHLNLGVSHSIIFKNTLAYTPVAKQWLYKQRQLLNNARNIHVRNNRKTVFSVVRDTAVSG